MSRQRSTALGSDTMENLGVKGFQDYIGLVPGLSQRGGGTPGVGTVIIRGLNSGPQQTTATTGYYFDDAPLPPTGHYRSARSFFRTRTCPTSRGSKC